VAAETGEEVAVPVAVVASRSWQRKPPPRGGTHNDLRLYSSTADAHEV